MLENYMVMERIEYGKTEKYWQEQDRIWAEKEDIGYQDKIFEEMNKEEN